MEALVLKSYNGGAVAVEVVPLPQPGRRQIVVRVQAVALNPVDVMNVDRPMAAQELRTIGSDFAGVVARIGSDLADVSDPRAKVGARVAGFVQGANSVNDRPGAFAEYLITDYDLTWLIPASFPTESAASVSLCALTAAQDLFYRLRFPCPFFTSRSEGRAQKADPKNVLINGAAGQVAHFAAQLVHLAARGLSEKINLIGVASTSKHTTLRQQPYSYNILVDYQDKDWSNEVKRATGGQGVHYGIDAASVGSSVASVEATLSAGGKFAAFRSPQAGGFDVSSLNVKPVIGVVWEGLGADIEYHGSQFAADDEARRFASSFFSYLSDAALRDEIILQPPPIRQMQGGLVCIAQDGFPLLRDPRKSAPGEDQIQRRPLNGMKMVFAL